jgi:hypothetical protein
VARRGLATEREDTARGSRREVRATGGALEERRGREGWGVLGGGGGHGATKRRGPVRQRGRPVEDQGATLLGEGVLDRAGQAAAVRGDGVRQARDHARAPRGVPRPELGVDGVGRGRDRAALGSSGLVSLSVVGEAVSVVGRHGERVHEDVAGPRGPRVTSCSREAHLMSGGVPWMSCVHQAGEDGATRSVPRDRSSGHCLTPTQVHAVPVLELVREGAPSLDLQPAVGQPVQVTPGTPRYAGCAA